MCLAVPGKIVEISRTDGAYPLGRVDFQGSTVEVCLALVPESIEGDWVLVHAGFAITALEESEALKTWDYLREAGLADALPEGEG